MGIGFSVTCLDCGEKMIIDKNFIPENDTSKITVSVMGKNDLLYFVCSNCKNEIEVEV